MEPIAHSPLRFPLQWLLLACAAVTASWLVTQWPFAPPAPRLSAPAVLPGNALPHITEERAIASALNDFEVSPGRG